MDRSLGVFLINGSKGANGGSENHLSKVSMFDVLRYDDRRNLRCILGVSAVLGVMSKVFFGPGFII